MKHTILLLAFSSLLAAQGQKAPAMSDPKYGDAAAIRALPLAKLNALLTDSQASEYAKAKACQRLATVGDRTSVNALAAHLGDERLSSYARTALEQIPGDEAAGVLRTALAKWHGNALIGIINSIGVRRDAKAVDALSRLLHSPDPGVPQAASAALARIRPPL